MTIINANTTKGRNFINRSSYYDGYTLRDVYSDYSYAKERAYQYCLNLCASENGSNFHIISHNTFSFSVAWETVDGVRIETSNNSYLIKF